MQTCYEIETTIPASHRLTIQLPATIPPGKAKVAVIYEVAEPPLPGDAWATFLASLPDNGANGLKREQIRDYLDRERQYWGD